MHLWLQSSIQLLPYFKQHDMKFAKFTISSELSVCLSVTSELSSELSVI